MTFSILADCSVYWDYRSYCPFHDLDGIIFRKNMGRVSIGRIDIDEAQHNYVFILALHYPANSGRYLLLKGVFGDIATNIIEYLKFPLEPNEIKTIQKKLRRGYDNMHFSAKEVHQAGIYANWVRICWHEAKS